MNVKHSMELKEEKANGSLVDGDDAENAYLRGNSTPSSPL